MSNPTSKQDVDAALYFVLWKVHGSPKGGRHALCDDIFRAAEILETEVLRARGEIRLLRETLQSVVDTSLPVSDRVRVFIRGALKNAATLESSVETSGCEVLVRQWHAAILAMETPDIDAKLTAQRRVVDAERKLMAWANSPAEETSTHDRRVDGWCHTCSSYTCSVQNGKGDA